MGGYFAPHQYGASNRRFPGVHAPGRRIAGVGMLLVAMGWLYVVGMYSVTQASWVAGLASFLFAGLVPASVLVWFEVRRLRRLRRQQAQAEREEARSVAVADQDPGQGDGPHSKRDQQAL